MIDPAQAAFVVRRARSRRRQRGASMFVVAITLGLLGAMGVYGLSAAASDMRAVGHLREALHAQRAAEHAMIMTAEAFNPMTGPRLVEELTGGATGQACPHSARPPGAAATATKFQNVEGCLSLTAAELQKVVNGAVTPNGVGTGNWATGTEPYTAESFFPLAKTSGETALAPAVTLEVTNAVETALPPGWDEGKDVFYELTVTSVALMKRNSANGATESTTRGRGRIVVGPARPMRRIAPAP